MIPKTTKSAIGCSRGWSEDELRELSGTRGLRGQQLRRRAIDLHTEPISLSRDPPKRTDRYPHTLRVALDLPVAGARRGHSIGGAGGDTALAGARRGGGEAGTQHWRGEAGQAGGQAGTQPLG